MNELIKEGFSEEFVKVLAKMGITTMRQLKEAAPYLERDYPELEGLCDALLVPKLPEARRPAPSRTGSSGGGFWDGCLNRVLIVCFLIALLLLGYEYAGRKLGFIKSEITLKIEGEQTRDYSGMTMVLVSRDGKRKNLSAAFGENGTATVEAATGLYDAYVLEDGMATFCTACESRGRTKGEYRLSYQDSLFSALLVRFVDVSGNALTPEAVQVSTSKEFQAYCDRIGDGLYAVIIPANLSDPQITFSTAGYEPVALSGDWSSARVHEVEVVLK